MAPVVDIVIPTFNQSQFTVACVRSLCAALPLDVFQILWVDNGSTAFERRSVEVELQAVQHVPFFVPENLGFVKATNIGMAASTAPFVLLLNNDTEMPVGGVESMLNTMDLEPSVGLVGPRSSAGRQWQASVPGALVSPHHTVLPPERMVAFFCTLIRREVIEKIGYLSERYRLGYGDDDEYCARAVKAGFKIALQCDVTVKHELSGTFPFVLDGPVWEGYKAENLRRLDEDLKALGES